MLAQRGEHKRKLNVRCIYKSSNNSIWINTAAVYFVGCYKRGENPFFEEIIVEEEYEN